MSSLLEFAAENKRLRCRVCLLKPALRKEVEEALHNGTVGRDTIVRWVAKMGGNISTMSIRNHQTNGHSKP